MKQKLQGILIGLIIGVLLSASAVYATDGASSISVYFKNLTFMFDGVEKKPDSPSFIYNGTTYVPIRFVSEALGKKVNYDGSTDTITVGAKRYAAPPDITIDPGKTYDAVVETTLGSFTIQLFAKDAPKTVNNFVFLANDGFYNRVLFHRILQSFVIQTGDPTGTGTGGPGYEFSDELNNGHRYETGIVAMANSGPDTNGSQFFICTGQDSENLNRMPNYTIFGKVTDGMDVVQAIAGTPVESDSYGERSKPKAEIEIKAIKIEVKN